MRARFGEFFVVEEREVFPLEEDASRGWRHEPDHRFEENCLSAAAFPDDGDGLSLSDAE